MASFLAFCYFLTHPLASRVPASFGPHFVFFQKRLQGPPVKIHLLKCSALVTLFTFIVFYFLIFVACKVLESLQSSVSLANREMEEGDFRPQTPRDGKDLAPEGSKEVTRLGFSRLLWFRMAVEPRSGPPSNWLPE